MNAIVAEIGADQVIERPRHTLIPQFLAEGAVFLAIARIAHDVGGAALHVIAAVQIGAPIAGDGRQRAWPDLPVDLGRNAAVRHPIETSASRVDLGDRMLWRVIGRNGRWSEARQRRPRRTDGPVERVIVAVSVVRTVFGYLAHGSIVGRRYNQYAAQQT